MSFQIPHNVSSGNWDIHMCSEGQRGLRLDPRAGSWVLPERRAGSDGSGFLGCCGTELFLRYTRLDRHPDILVLQVGGNDLGLRPMRQGIKDIHGPLLIVV